MMSHNQAGRLLIASPYLRDGNFLRSVVLMVRHDAEGAFGLVINRPTQQRVRELVDLPDSGPIREDDQIFIGGPVAGPLLALHELPGIGEPCGTGDPSGEWITGDEKHLRMLMMRPQTRIRFVANYSGWGAGQLEDELRMGGWLSGEADREIVFGDPDKAWEAAVKQFGNGIFAEIAPGIRIGNPNLN
jgi:putative transcriptional regulator